MIEKTLVHFKTKENFEKELSNIKDTSIVFVKDSHDIHTHGETYKTVTWSKLGYTSGIPNNEIWYKTSDNQPLNIPDFLDFKDNQIISNEYDQESDYFIIRFKKPFTEFPEMSRQKYSYYDGEMTQYEYENIGLFNYYDEDSYGNGKYFKNITELILPRKIKAIPDHFLLGISLKSLLFSEGIEITTIGEYFLADSSLETIDLSNLTKLTEILKGFLSYDKQLTSINLTNLINLDTIGSDFLYYCDKLSKIDFSGFINVSNILGSMLSWCSKLKTIIINNRELITVPLEKIYLNYTENIREIYVNDELIEQYKEAVPKFEDLFKPLSEYNPE